MCLWEIFIVLAITFLSVAKPIVFRPIAQKYKMGFSSTIMALWLIVGILISLPFKWNDLCTSLSAIVDYPLSVIVATLKGVIVFYSIEYAQLVNKKSTSSYMFSRFVSLAVASFVLNIFFGENLSFIKLFSIIGLGILGLIFCYFGDINRLSLKWKKYFIIAILLAAACPIVDHFCIKQLGWYLYFIISNVCMLIFTFIRGIKWQDIKIIFSTKNTCLAGLFITAYEFVIISSSVSVLPVSIVSFFARLSVPIVMVYSAIRYQESTIKKQFIFGLSALMIALPIILGK